MTVQTKDLWGLVLDQQWVDPQELADAIVDQVQRRDLDYRSRLLIRDGVAALRKHWGPERVARWLAACPAREEIEAICREEFERPGFPSLERRLMEPTRPETVEQFLRELGLGLQRPVQVRVGGVIALILAGYVSRKTDDVDVVDEVPAEYRAQPKLLDALAGRYGLHLTHFQSHYLPSGWEQRLHSRGPFGRLHVYLVDAIDVFLSKLFSAREKDRDDLRAVAPQLDKETLVRRLRETTAPLRADEEFRQRAEANWYILYGEPLPS